MKEGSPFCKSCGAPQIRVESDVPVERITTTTSEASESPNPEQTELQKPLHVSERPTAAHVSSPIHWGRALPAVLLAAVFESVFNLFGLGVVAGGYMAVSLYRRRQIGQFITAGMGARLGAVAGGLAFFIVSVFASTGVLFFHTGNQFRDAIMQSLQQVAARNPSPEAQQMVDYLRSPDGFALFLGFALVITLVFHLVLSTIGGIIATAVANRRPRR